MKLTVVGLGYIGLPTSIMFAKHGVDVLGVDINQKTIDSLQSGKVNIEEPGLQEVFEEVLEAGKLKVSTQPAEADAFIISVPTPNNDDEYESCDISIVLSAVNSVLPHLKKGDTIIVESTIAPRTMDDHVKPLIEEKGFTIGEDVYLVHCPERVLPGKILEELVYNNRIIGGVTPNCVEAGKRVYSTFVQGEMIETNARTAEMSKLMENTYRDLNIALANEITKISNNLDVNVLDVIEMANKHPRVNIHSPGPGVGGHCLAVDPYFIIAKDPEHSPLIQTGRKVNRSMPEYVVENVKRILSDVEDAKVSVFGLTYKGDVDDIRESPAFDIYKLLQEESLEVTAYDPHVELDFVEKDIKNATENASLVLILSDHSEFKSFKDSDFVNMKNKIIFDTKNVVKSSFDEVSYFNYGNLYETRNIKLNK
ncbi:UDP-N-acetyl-D-mannosamine dehydrogenase [Staphylococcus haemolyticus]|uniref:nucleotide sugar dehydrogenase n=1 Tax=Staphylococcus haemolyticus TaxID=1283 RepID=UPI00044AFF19|nr:nucleotide sugar dehydrogenase [Staphylococcus haemolyticus]KDP49127.1 nucleotide sugar dehydrogenase [Staphylococcus aureus subsp. aureus CO-98]AKC75188.1 capsular polysaccharide biosynthesis protein Cap5O [Staphylococcus haemolyticus]AMW24369.1 UDP-N-acetyl-D-mannosamine dehydrogenase [Staphylococcus haemolyticus]EZI38535.1 capsular polysaccharide synthesis enzyme [Staphylococcus haemolyticus]MBF9287829.1 nucleotide sugar dehydrogenase [Staphylococcus haemolyticus]